MQVDFTNKFSKYLLNHDFLESQKSNIWLLKSVKLSFDFQNQNFGFNRTAVICQLNHKIKCLDLYAT